MKSRFSLWAAELASQIIEGASDAFLAVMGGSTAAQFATVPMPAVTPKQLLLSMGILAGIYAASFLKKYPVPSKMPTQLPEATPAPVQPSAISDQPSASEHPKS